MKKLAIYGAGGLGREVASLVNAINYDIPSWKINGFFDDGIDQTKTVHNYPILGGIKEAKNFEGHLIIALGNPELKSKIVNALGNKKYAILIHPKAVIMDQSVEIGEGSIITAGAVLTTNIKVGNHCLINLNTTVGHDSEIGNYSSIMCGVNIAGNVEVGEGVLVGSGANILNGLKIGDNSLIGAGSVVNKNIKSNATAVGIPARLV